MKRQILAWLGLAIYQLYYLHPLVSGAAALALQGQRNVQLADAFESLSLICWCRCLKCTQRSPAAKI